MRKIYALFTAVRPYKSMCFRMFAAVCILLLGITPTSRLFSQTVTFTTSGSFTPAAGVTSITVEAWGAGGGGSSKTTNGSLRGGGGGGGAYANSTLAVSSSTTYNVVVGVGGAANTTGTNSTFNTNSVVAAGGSGGTLNST